MGIARLLYNLGLGAYHAGIKLSAPFNPKARLWVDGRVGWQKQLSDILNGQPTIWVHCASLGEYEQGKPIIDALETQYPKKQVVVSFYSPSGYEVVKRKEPQRAIIYLPPDSADNASEFLRLLKPQLAIFVKYEFWYHYLHQLKQQGTPTLLVSGIFREGQPFFKPWGGLHREMLGCFTHLFVQDGASEKLLQSIGITKVTISGDTRFDRVLALQNHSIALPHIERFVGNTPTLIAGSTWPADEELLITLIPELLNHGWKLIIAPHDIHIAHIQELQQTLEGKAISYSAWESNPNQDFPVLIIDSVGMLAHIYQYGQLAYIGGGFGKGIHNTLEAAAQGLPIVFGPNYQKFKEAVDLVEHKAAWSIQNYAELAEVAFPLLKNPDNLSAPSQRAKAYVQEQQGATERIMTEIKVLLPVR